MGVGMILICIGLVVHQLEAMIVRFYGKKYKKGGMFFNAVICLFAMIYFFASDEGALEFPKGVCLYGALNSIMYATGFYSAYAAFKLGSFGLSRLFTSFGVIVPTFYGIVFLKEPTTLFTYIAFVLILLSLFLMNYQGKESSSQKISFRWILSILFIVISNAAIAIIGRVQYGVYGNTYKNEFLIISLAGATIALLIFGFIFERDSFKVEIKHCLAFGALAGIFNGIGNLLTLITYEYLPISFISPVKSGAGIVISFLVSIILYKESFTKRQLISVGIGALAVVLMNF